MTGAHRGSLLRAVAVLLTWSVVGATGVLAWVATGGSPQQVRVMSVLSGSMVPALDVGDLVVTRVVRPADLGAGDLVTYRDPGHDRFVTHRVQSVVWRGDLADVVTRGDANDAGEEWTIAADGTVGLVVLRLPAAGYVLGVMGTPAGQLAVGVLAVSLAFWAIELIWQPGPSPAAWPVHGRAAAHERRDGRAVAPRAQPQAVGRAG